MQTRTTLTTLVLTALLMATPAGARAQAAAATPETREMIEALKPSPTRTLRNLVVRQTAEGETAASAPAVAPSTPPPSLSLAIPFDSNSAQVRPESGPVLGNLVAALQSPELKGARFAIEGHTDARGSAGANQVLSQERAEQVRLYLIALGVQPARLKAVGKGASEPVNPLDPGAAENRRVRVVTLP